MTNLRVPFPLVLLVIALASAACAPRSPSATATAATRDPADPLPSWREGATRRHIVDFVAAVTDPDSSDFVPPAERVAVFDNDGTLWAEKPLYFQLLFAVDRVRELAPQHPEWRRQEPFAALLRGDFAAALAGGEKAILEIVMATHAGMTTDEFDATVRRWLATATHPESGRAYTAMVYAPMLELLDFLRASGFRTYIVSGGGVDMIRTFSEPVYGIPPEQVIGSSIELAFELRADEPVLVRRAAIDFIDDKAGKPVGIHRHIGRRPIAAFGNSDGDLPMLQWTTAGEGRRLGVLLHHTDAGREWAYDRDSAVGRLDKALAAAGANGWIVVDMIADWKRVFPADR